MNHRDRFTTLLRLSAPVAATLGMSAAAWAQDIDEPAANATADVGVNVPDTAPVGGSPAESAIDDTPQVESQTRPEMQPGNLDPFGRPMPAPMADYSAGPDEQGFASFEERVSYAIGTSMGRQMVQEFRQLDFNVDAQQFGQGFGDAADENAVAKLTEAQMQETLMQFQSTMQQRQMAKLQESMNADADFLATNAAAEGVMQTDTGVQYKINELGDGPKPGPTDTVLVHYEGKMLDGTVFDSSIQRGQPAPFPLDRVVPGFQAGLTQMPIGSKATLYIPGEQAYGMRPPPQSGIGPNQMLIFDVELIELVEQPEMPAMDVMEQVPDVLEDTSGD
jgi:FKBP-type peptidyl-prolyl cis-trans isomerase